jgi:subtilisin family serine protease
MTAVPATAQPLPDEPAAAGVTRFVTLVTGDKVVVQNDRVAGVRMAEGREHVRTWQYRSKGRDHVVPLDALPLLRDDRLDARLFDVTGLLEQHYDDAHEPVVPTLVGGMTGQAQAQADPLGRLGLVKRDIPKTEAAGEWRKLSGARIAQAGKVWLNGRVRPTLDRSVAQVGAPQAWRAGLRGDGVKVAVLDTGYDGGHPELKSQVEAAADFTGEGDAGVDADGHGTHVASTIAGVGDRYTGVAPGARLLVGKVLGRNGGREDWVLSGMQWAVDQGAKVVNMSLGGGVSDGNDLMSQTVNRLSESTGALFVVAAGNSGAASTVGSPGSADRALTVGSVTKDDRLSAFSSRGPRVGDFGLKPEITAPGSDIVAARAAGTLPSGAVDERHARLSGTSMATPHVAGAAAILAGQHPGWTGDQIKNALVGSSLRLPDIDTHAQGAGRLDVARATGQSVRVEGLAGFGEVWGGQRIQRKVSYVNDGDREVRLALTPEVNRPDLVEVERTLTVPAKSAASVTVTLLASSAPGGEVTGALVARGGDVVLTTPLTANLMGDAHALTVRATAREGDVLRSLYVVTNERTGWSAGVVVWDGVEASFTVPAGDYRVTGITQDTSGAMALFAERASVAGTTALVVDAKRAEPIVASIDDPDARAGYGGATAIVSDVDQDGPLPADLVSIGGTPDDDARVYSIGGPTMPGLELVQFSYFTPPHVTAGVTGDGGFELDSATATWPLGFEGRLTARLVDIGLGAPDPAVDLTGAIVLVAPPDWDNAPWDGEQVLRAIEAAKARGAKAALSYIGPRAAPALPTVSVFDAGEIDAVRELMRQRPVEVSLLSRAGSPTAYFVADRVTGAVPSGHEFRYRRDGLGSIERQLVDTRTPGTYRFHYGIWTLGGLTALAEVETIWPQRRIDYASPGAALSMAAAVGFDGTVDFGFETTVPVVLGAGERRASRVFGAPFGPELTTPPTSRQDGRPLPWAYREGDQVVLSIPMFADSDPGNAAQFDSTNQGTTTLARGGRQVGRTDVPGIGTFDVTSGTYKLSVDARRPAAEAALDPALSTRTSAEWTFHTTKGTGRKALPLLDVRFGLPLDDRNRAAAGEPLTGTVTVAHQPGAPAVRARVQKVEVSFDEGKTWRRAGLSNDKVTIPPGASGGYVSLRASAVDMAGNAVTETIIRAYALR